jgi:hypothetical protein
VNHTANSEPFADPGPLVRPFAITRGRAGSSNVNGLDMITLVVVMCSETDARLSRLDREYVEIVRVCQQRPLSIAEIAAKLDLMVAAVKVLVGDLIDSGYVVVRSPAHAQNQRPGVEVLQTVLGSIRNL